MRRKKIKFQELKAGQKFKYQRKLFLKDSLFFPICISDGKVFLSMDMERIKLDANTLVTPVKIKITVL